MQKGAETRGAICKRGEINALVSWPQAWSCRCNKGLRLSRGMANDSFAWRVQGKHQGRSIAALHFKGCGEGGGGGGGGGRPSAAPQRLPRLLAGAGNREQSRVERPRVRDGYFQGEKLSLLLCLFELRVGPARLSEAADLSGTFHLFVLLLGEKFCKFGTNIYQVLENRSTGSPARMDSLTRSDRLGVGLAMLAT